MFTETTRTRSILCQYFPKKLPHVDGAGPSRRRRAGGASLEGPRPKNDHHGAGGEGPRDDADADAAENSLRALSSQDNNQRTEHASTSVCVSRRHQLQQQLVYGSPDGVPVEEASSSTSVCLAHRRLSSCPVVSPRSRGD